MREVPRTITHTYTRDIHTWQSQTYSNSKYSHYAHSHIHVQWSHSNNQNKKFVQRGNKKSTSASVFGSSLTAVRVTKYRLSSSTALLAAALQLQLSHILTHWSHSSSAQKAHNTEAPTLPSPSLLWHATKPRFNWSSCAVYALSHKPTLRRLSHRSDAHALTITAQILCDWWGSSFRLRFGLICLESKHRRAFISAAQFSQKKI